MRGAAFFSKYLVSNLCAFLLMMVSPIAWASPFAAAYAAAAGLGAVSYGFLLPGLFLGALVSKGGIAGAVGAVCAYGFSNVLKGRQTENARAIVSVIALLCCLAPSLSFHLAGGSYDTAVCVLSSFAAMGAAPVMCAYVKRGISRKLYPDAEERAAFFLLISLSLAGALRLFSPAGYFLIGLFSLLMAFGGIFSSAVGALAGAVSLLLGNGEAEVIALLFLCACASGALSGKGAVWQSAVFLVGIPLSVYFDAGRESVFLLSSAAVYPWIPRAIRAYFLRYTGFFQEKTHMYLTVSCARRHLPRDEQKICGDTGAVEKLSGGRMLFMLADGMGTGEEAKRISLRALESAKNLFRAPLSADDALKCVNTLCRDENSALHTTLDVCMMDLVTGRVRLLKSGAEPTWLVGKRGVLRLEGEGLPLGVLTDAPGSITEEMVEPGDLVFMATDGLIHALGGADSAECALISMKNLSAGTLCAEMMKKAKNAEAALRRDDMSVLCVRVCLRNPSETQRRFLPFPKEAENAVRMRKAG